MKTGFKFIINEDFYLYLKDNGKALNSQEFTYQYGIDKIQSVVELAELNTGEKSVKLCLAKNLHGLHAISKYYIYKREEFERGSLEYRRELLKEMCSILGKSTEKDYSYDQYKKMRNIFLYEFYFEINKTGTPYNLKDVKSIKNISSVNDDTFFNNILISNEVDLLNIMYGLI